MLQPQGPSDRSVESARVTGVATGHRVVPPFPRNQANPAHDVGPRVAVGSVRRQGRVWRSLPSLRVVPYCSARLTRRGMAS